MKRDRAVTILVVIGIIALLVSIVLPPARAWKIHQWETQTRRCQSNVRRIGQALQLYATEHNDGWAPDLHTLVTAGYLDADSLRCPVAVANGANADYIYHRPGLPVSRTAPDTLIVEDAPAHFDDGGNCLFADGHTQYLTSAELRAARHPPTTAPTLPSPPSIDKTAG